MLGFMVIYPFVCFYLYFWNVISHTLTTHSHTLDMFLMFVKNHSRWIFANIHTRYTWTGWISSLSMLQLARSHDLVSHIYSIAYIYIYLCLVCLYLSIYLSVCLLHFSFYDCFEFISLLPLLIRFYCLLKF